MSDGMPQMKSLRLLTLSMLRDESLTVSDEEVGVVVVLEKH